MMLNVDGLGHRYGTERALDDVSFGLDTGELVAVLGPSGCGKTTLVQAIAGHLTPTAGRVRLRGHDVTGQPPERRAVGLVFQQSTLYPHMTVGENVAYGLGPQGVDPDEHEAIVDEYLDLVNLADRRTAYPNELSGGQQRRAELARALAPQPDLLVLDEPLSALDRALRVQLRGEIARIQRETGVTTLFVTHDQQEAMELADRLVVMHGGAVAAVGPPRRLYESPPTPFVASFLGRSTELPATIAATEPLRLAVGGDELTLPDAGRTPPVGASVRCLFRPHGLSIRPPEDADAELSGTVRRVADLGRRYDVTVETDDGTALVVERRREPPAVGEAVAVAVDAGSVVAFTAAGEPIDAA
ncbi:ABC transporter ATP-binding protein [Halohasta salina]|uniref:ABC transporter ATP-binding protein n=1 Tax=Halohasta salina TaxID=2961621 RepID=UPI0020A236B3|nr:ABC transporter ATP-binding protein [Halohasta salina]